MKNNREGKAAPLTPEQFQLLLDNAPDPKYRFLWTLQRNTAGRISECLALKWGSVNATHICFKKASTKTKTSREVIKSDQIKVALEEYRLIWAALYGREPGEEDFLFPARFSDLTPLTRQAADLVLRKTCKAIGLKGVSLHSFRRTAAMDAAAKGVPYHVIKELTGHKSLDGLSKYLTATDEDVLACLQ